MLRVDVSAATARGRRRGVGGGEGEGGGSGSGGSGGSGSGADLRSAPVGSCGGGGLLRRESFLYRPDVLDGELSPTRSRQSFRSNSAPLDEIIVTPFAQLIDSLRRVKSNWLLIFKTLLLRQTTSRESDAASYSHLTDDCRQRVAMETLEEIEWCLDQLETMQTDRSAAQIATNKFKRMLSRELYQYVESDKDRHQVSQYISRTFLNEEEEGDVKRAAAAVAVVAAEVPKSRMKLSQDRHHTHTHSETGGLLTLKDNAKALIRKNCTTFYPTNTPPHVIPKYGVKAKDEEQLSKEMQQVSTWGMDMFTLAHIAASKPLTAVTYTILKERGLLETFMIPPDILLNFLSNLENHYKSDIPYHNSLHAADVTQSSHVLLLLPAFRNFFTDLEILATIFASAVHDVDHPGLNSQFLINSNSELAILYNDESVLENHHLAVAFQLLQQDKCDVFSNINNKQRQNLRHLVIGMVLATDMSKHMQHLAHLKTIVELRRLSANNRLELEKPSVKQQILQSLVHCADLSNPTKSWDVYSKWTAQVMEEFFRQGDKEKQLGLDVSPMCDRNTARVASSQIGFIDFVVRPLWETWADLVSPDCQHILQTLEDNRQRHVQHVEKEHQQDSHQHHTQVASRQSP